MYRSCFIYFLIFLAILSESALANSVTMPLGVVKKPAGDLIQVVGGKKQKISTGAATTMAENKVDISLFNPNNNRLWQNEKHKTSNVGDLKYPAKGSTVEFLFHEASNQFTYMGRVQGQGQLSKEYYRLSLSRYTHTTLMRAALMRKLGYFVPSPKRYDDLTVKFKSKEKLENFLTYSQEAMTTDFESRQWVKKKVIDEKKKIFTVTFASATLEPAVSDYFDVHWGFVPNPDIPAQRPIVTRFSKFRAFRALIVPMVLVDVPESINRFSPKAVSNLSERLILTHPSGNTFATCTYEDARWLVRRFANWTKKDWREVVDFAEFPKGIDDLIYAKLINRVRNFFEHFNVEPKNKIYTAFGKKITDPKLDFTTNDIIVERKRENEKGEIVSEGKGPLIEKGKVTTNYLPGYPQRFAHGDRPAPFREGDVRRFLSIEGKTAGIKIALDELSSKMQILTTSDAFTKYQEDLRQDVLNHLQNNPGKIFQKRIGFIHGPTFGPKMSASRHITTGTFFDSDAPVQLVDNVTLGASVGYFSTVNGINGFNPILGGNVTLQRNYIHVRPIESVEVGTKQKWGELLVPRAMSKLGDILVKDPENTNTPGDNKNQKDSMEPFLNQFNGKELAEVNKEIEESEQTEEDGENTPEQHPVDKFLAELKVGEVFTITDSLIGSARVGASSPLNFLLGLSPVGFVNSISLGFDATKALVLQQTSFHRVQDGINVYVRTMDTTALGVQFDVNYYLNLLRLRLNKVNSKIKTDGFVIRYSPEIAADANPDSHFGAGILDTRKKLQPVLRALFKENDPELLYGQFPYDKFDIDHKLKTKELRGSFLAQRFSEFTEEQDLELRYPPVEGFGFTGAEEEPTRHIYLYRRGRLMGTDIFGFLKSAVEGIIGNNSGTKDIFDESGSSNPANQPFGKAEWKLLTTEADISPLVDQEEGVTIFQHVWGGWKLKKKKFFKLMDDIEAKYDGLVENGRLIDREIFTTVKSIQFYRVMANLSILESGVNNVRDLLVRYLDQGEPSKKGNADFMYNVCSPTKSNWPSDLKYANDFLSMWGEGNCELGKVRYYRSCVQYQRTLVSHDTEYRDIPEEPKDLVNFNKWKKPSSFGMVGGELEQLGYGSNYKKVRYNCYLPWYAQSAGGKGLLELRRQYPNKENNPDMDETALKRARTKWATQVIYALEENIPLPAILKQIGKEHYIFFIRINGFREGDEDGDIEYFSNTSGDPTEGLEDAFGLIQRLSRKTGISPVILDRTNASFR